MILNAFINDTKKENQNKWHGYTMRKQEKIIRTGMTLWVKSDENIYCDEEFWQPFCSDQFK